MGRWSMSVTKTVFKVGDFVSWQKAGQLQLSPKFQRRSVWKKGAKSYLIDTIARRHMWIYSLGGMHPLGAHLRRASNEYGKTAYGETDYSLCNPWPARNHGTEGESACRTSCGVFA